jgi:hypothetical protein
MAAEWTGRIVTPLGHPSLIPAEYLTQISLSNMRFTFELSRESASVHGRLQPEGRPNI